jgi:dTDP-4-amino-4,6-dideoxygalactose transaminase
MGARIKDKPVGSFGDIGFFSFNRGKNLPANNGGCIIARNSSCEQAVLGAVNACASPAAAEWAGAFLNTMLLVIGTDPLVYGMGHALAAGFRETAPPQDLSVSTLGHFQSSLCLRGLRKADAMFMARYRIGMALIRGLQGVPGLRLPAIGADYLPVFNRLPILLEDDTKVQPAQSTLWQRGIESSRMYEKPLHHMFDLGYSRDDFPNARFLAKHLLTLPVHPSVQDSHIKIMIDTLRGVL